MVNTYRAINCDIFHWFQHCYNPVESECVGICVRSAHCSLLINLAMHRETVQTNCMGPVHSLNYESRKL